MVTVPVVFIIFNRKETAQKVFDAIRQAGPKKLYVIADGPRENIENEAVQCRETKRIIDQVDWKCAVRKNYARRNMGCGERISSGLDWVFKNEDEAIILEDDCVPAQSFFTYCEELLHRYKDDSRVMHINGSNFTEVKMRNDDSFFFSRYVHVWGWATWRRAWIYYDYAMKSWPRLRDEGWMEDIFSDNKAARYWTKFLDLCYEKRIVPSTWDYQWLYTIWSQGGVCITPQKNLISNIGLAGIHSDFLIGDPATRGFLRKRSEDFRITKHPAFVIPDHGYDRYHFRKYFFNSLPKRIHRRFWRLLH